MACMEHYCHKCNHMEFNNNSMLHCPNCGSMEISSHWDEQYDHHGDDYEEEEYEEEEDDDNT